jgi:two-component sensor histidine kinase
VWLAFTRQTLRHVSSDELHKLTSRLHALGEAHDLLTAGDWHQASLRDVVQQALKPFASNQVVIEGPIRIIC